VQVASKTAADDIRDGIVCALISYFIWGILPVYIKLVGSVAPLEVLAHRVIWAVPFGALIVIARRQGGEILHAMRNARMLGILAVSAVMIAINWFIYIVAVQQEQIFQASLGYYINPLMYVIVGVAFLGEKLRRFQMIAVVLATIGVLVLTLSGGQFPWIALSLAVLFTIYGVIRKQIAIGGMPGLFVETIVLFPLAATYWTWLAMSGGAAFSPAQPGLAGLLMLAGPLTVLPLLFFALAARRLPLSLIGFLQFIAPTLQFVMGLLYGEVLTTAHVICFGLIWTAVAFFVTDAWRQSINSAHRDLPDLG
jgi:chloramphenicol-sensitive protein RarD